MVIFSSKFAFLNTNFRQEQDFPTIFPTAQNSE